MLSCALGLAALAAACGDSAGVTTGTTGATTAQTTVLTTDPTGPTGEVVCLPDAFEPNNASADATPIDDGEFTASACPFDIDFYSFSITQATYLSTILHMKRSDGQVMVMLHGPEMQALRVSSGNDGIPAYAGTASNAIEAIHEKLRTPGTYHLSVTHMSGDEIPYRLDLQRFVDQTP